MLHCANFSPVDVGGFAPNAFGLHDMHGNVSELCYDSYATFSLGTTDPGILQNRLVRRGGSFHNWFGPERGSGMRLPELQYNFIGFRVVLAPDLTIQ
jgi:formylglycine-generating enzyme required for sulfatase activity